MNARTTIAVTGATGFVGGRLLTALRDAGYAVRAFVRDVDRMSGVDAVAWHAGDPPPPGSLDDVGAVAFCAAFLPERYDDPAAAEQCLAVNALAPLAFARAAAAADVRRFVYLSSGNVYRPQMRPVDEDDPIEPVGRAPYYLASKAVGDVWVRALDGHDGLSTVVVRPSAIYGPGMGRGVVRTFVERVSRGQGIRVANGGRHAADHVWVGDVVGAVSAALTVEGTGAFNVGSGRATTTLELARQLQELLGVDAAAVQVEPPSDEGPSSFAPLDVTRARNELGLRPTSIAEGLAQFLTELGVTR